MNYVHSTRKPGNLLFLVLSSLFCVSLFLCGAGIAGEVSVPIPSETVQAGQTVTLPVILYGAENINGYQITVSELSGGDVTINSAAAMVDGTKITGNGKKAVLLTTSEPLNGDTTLFSVDVTPVSGKNAIVSVEVVEIMNTNDDSLVAQYPGKDTIIPVVNGKTEYIKESVNTVQTTVTASPTSITPIYSERSSSSSTPSASTSDLSLPTSAATAKPTNQSPGFLPLTVLLAGGVAAGLFALRRRS